MFVAVSLALAAGARAQQPLSLRGRVIRQRLDGVKAVAREPVTLHRVNAKDAGPIDSAVTDARGGYAFRVSTPDSQSMYLVSARFGGIAYFSQPVQVGAPAAASEIVVYDTTSADVRLQLQGRHFVVSSPSAEGVRSVIDVLEIENDTVLTRVPGAANRPTYTLLLPDGARSVRASQGETEPGAVEVRNGRAELFAPLSPGLRQVVLTYELPPDVFPLSIPLERTVGVLEVLVEEAGASVTGGGLVSQGGVTVDGKNFTRYLGQNSPASAVLTLAVVGGGAGSALPSWLLPLVLAAVTLGAIVMLARRAPATTPVGAARRARTTTPPAAAGTIPGGSHAASMIPGTVQQLARRVAAVDAVLEREPQVTADARDDLEQYRASLKAELVGALANEVRDQ